jgi:signal transduction histidine kinase
MPARSSLVTRLVAPVVGLVLAAVLANVGFSAWWSARQAAHAARTRREQVAAALELSRIPLAPPVLEALHQLTGDHYVVWNATTNSPGAATLQIGVDTVAAIGRGTDVVTSDGVRYRIGTVRSAGVRPETVAVLSPIRPIVASTLEAEWPVLAVAAATLSVLVPLGLWTTRRVASRIGEIDRHVERITAGEFGHALAEDDRRDDPAEVARLVSGVNRMSGTLASLRDSLAAGERQRLLGQLAAGFAHELRNAITGARLAIDLHRRRCPAGAAGVEAADESLAVATRQLAIVEEEVRGLLALGKPSAAAARPVDVHAVIGEVADLVGPRAAHAGVRVERPSTTAAQVMGQGDALRAALVNLALNGIDAAGAGGSVRLAVESEAGMVRLVVDDTGPGPSPGISRSMTEPFVTGKPEGIGLGLAVARAVAEAHGGRLEWERSGGVTRFAIVLPVSSAGGFS